RSGWTVRRWSSARATGWMRRWPELRLRRRGSGRTQRSRSPSATRPGRIVGGSCRGASSEDLRGGDGASMSRRERWEGHRRYGLGCFVRVSDGGIAPYRNRTVTWRPCVLLPWKDGEFPQRSPVGGCMADDPFGLLGLTYDDVMLLPG